MAVGGAAQADRLFQHGIEHRREIAGRRVDHLEHLGGGGLARQRLIAFGGTLPQLRLKLGDGPLYFETWFTRRRHLGACASWFCVSYAKSNTPDRPPVVFQEWAAPLPKPPSNNSGLSR